LANPITGSTLLQDPAIQPSGTGYETGWIGNGNLVKAVNNYIMTYVAWKEPHTSPYQVRSSFASIPVSSFPGTFNHVGLTPQTPDQETYYDVNASPAVVYDPVEGKWHLFQDVVPRSGPVIWFWGHLSASGTADSFPSSESFAYDAATSVSTLQPSAIATITNQGANEHGINAMAPAPKAGGGWIIFATTECIATNYLISISTNDYLGSNTWGNGTLLNAGSYGSSTYQEYFAYFVYNGNYYWIVNTQNTSYASGSPANWTEKLYSSSSQTSGLNYEATFPIKYLTSLCGYSANSGTIYGLANSSVYPKSSLTIGNSWPAVFSINTNAVANPEPVLSDVSLSASGNTRTITGTATPGDGGALWEVGLYNSHTGTRSRATWGSWGEDSPGTVANTFSGTIAASEGDEIYVTVYNVAMESDTEIIIAMENRVDINKGKSTILIV
jgi:hypothetical protein